MRLGEQPDPRADRARKHLHEVCGWLRRRWPRLALFALLILVVGGVGMGVGLVVAGLSGNLDKPDLSNGPILTVAGLLHAGGLYPLELLLILSGIKNVNIGLPSHVVEGALSTPEQIELDIAEIDYQRLAYERDTALRQGIWVPSDDDYVPITIRAENRTLRGKARLKGDWYDHWYGENGRSGSNSTATTVWTT